ncbi:MAG: nucleotidyltransferase substrate binding protein [Elusimicrobia bacterium]|nr:nucleotidyltransferase substrate binding protein [Elusimicrobiota bacterium]
MAQTEKFRRTFEKFEKAFKKYQEIVKNRKILDSIDQNFVVEITAKRFEYTFESLWKTLQEYLRSAGADAATPLHCFKEAFRIGLIEGKHEGTFVEMAGKRNQIVHLYDEETAKAIHVFIKNRRTYEALEAIWQKLKKIR